MRFLPSLAFLQVSAVLAQTPPIPTFADRYDYEPCETNGPGDSIAAADFNGDGIPDLICSDGGFWLFIGNGNGTFGPPTLTKPLGSDDLATPLPVDLNGDGNMASSVSHSRAESAGS